MPDIYLIDGQAVNDRQDWTNPPAVSATAAARQESFPGSGVTYAITATKRGPQVVIEGWLVGTDSTTLREAVAAADALRFDAELHEVKILGTTYADCRLVQPLGIIGRPVAFKDGSSTLLRQAVRYVWQQLSAEGASS